MPSVTFYSHVREDHVDISKTHLTISVIYFQHPLELVLYKNDIAEINGNLETYIIQVIDNK